MMLFEITVKMEELLFRGAASQQLYDSSMIVSKSKLEKKQKQRPLQIEDDEKDAIEPFVR